MTSIGIQLPIRQLEGVIQVILFHGRIIMLDIQLPLEIHQQTDQVTR